MIGQTTCRCGQCTGDIQEEFRNQLLTAEKASGVQFVVTSGYRCPAYNAQVGGVAGSAHTKGIAVDLAIADGPTRFAIIKALLALGFVRMGISIRQSFIHCDKDLDAPQNDIWGYL